MLHGIFNNRNKSRRRLVSNQGSLIMGGCQEQPLWSSHAASPSLHGSTVLLSLHLMSPRGQVEEGALPRPPAFSSWAQRLFLACCPYIGWRFSRIAVLSFGKLSQLHVGADWRFCVCFIATSGPPFPVENTVPLKFEGVKQTAWLRLAVNLVFASNKHWYFHITKVYHPS